MTSLAPTSSGKVITFALEGVNCGGCVLKIEKHLASCKGVSFARGNATQRRLRIIADQEIFTEDEVIREIENLGYGAQQIGASETTSHRSPLPQLAVAGFGTMNIMAFSFSVWAGAFTDMGAGTMLFMHWLYIIFRSSFLPACIKGVARGQGDDGYTNIACYLGDFFCKPI